MARRVFAVLVLMLAPLLAVAVDYPPYSGYVNDFASIIPDDREEAMEQKLRSYEKETSVEIAVVTTPSLGGMSVDEWTIGLARKWGVGKKSQNNGLVIAIAPEERKYRIEVGYGLEGAITDGVAGQLARDALPNAFRAGDYAGGIDKLLDSLMGTIGHQSAEERAKAIAEHREAEKLQAQRNAEQLKAIGEGAVVVISILSGIFVVFLLVRRVMASIKERQRRNRVRKEASAKLVQFEDGLAKIGQRVADMHPAPLPPWILDKVNGHRQAISRAIESAGDVKRDVLANIEDDPDLAMQETDRYEDLVEELQGHLVALFAVEDTIRQFRARAEQSAKGANASVQDTLAIAERMTGLGFRLEGGVSQSSLDALKSAAAALAKVLAARGEGAKDRSDEVLRAAEDLAGKAQRAKNSLDVLSAAKGYVETHVPDMVGRLNSLQSALAQVAKTLGGIRGSSPKRAWSDTGRHFDGVEDSVKRIRALLDTASAKNSMQAQSFAEAKRDVQSAEALYAEAESAIQSVADLERGIADARKQYPELLRQTEAAISGAEAKTRDSDVGATAKQKLSNAKVKLTEAKQAVSTNPADWLLSIALLAEAGKLAAEAKRRAQSDIDDAEEERRRRRRREEEAAAALVASSYSSSSSPSSSSSFGGGSFGGGGASGDW